MVKTEIFLFFYRFQLLDERFLKKDLKNLKKLKKFLKFYFFCYVAPFYGYKSKKSFINKRVYKKIKTIEINRFQWLLTLLSKQIAQCMNLNRFDYCWWSTTQTPKLFSRGTNIRFVPTKSDWV